jgi:dihydroflavonol-4-reductase
MTRILVTGANGHVGANVVRSLLRRGYEVVAFVRQTSNLRGLEGLRLTYRYGDIMDVESLRAAAKGCAVIIHTAAVYRFWVDNSDDLIQSALLGVRHVFAAAQAAGVKRIVYTSSTFAVGASRDPDMLRTADDWNDELHLPYTIGKVRAEKLAGQLAEEMGIELIVLCPNGILGPYDYGITQTTELLRGLINGAAVTSEGGVSFVDVRDVAEVHAQAVAEGEPGERYVLAGERMTMRALGEILMRLTGVRPRHIGGGRRVLWLIGGLMELGTKLSGSAPTLTRAMALELVERYHYYDCTKTERSFGFAPRQGEEVVADAIRWLLYLGEIKPQIAVRLTTDLPPDPQWRAVPA